jgi:alanine racemase
MDQFVVDLGDPENRAGVAEGDVAVLFGDGRHGGPTAQDWAEAAGTISYEIVARIGVRLPRRYVGAGAHLSADISSGISSEIRSGIVP